MSQELRAAVIGCGAMGEIHTQCLAQLDGMKMVAYCDTFVDRAKTLHHKYGGSYCTSDPEQIFRDDTVDAVYICTHHDTHSKMAIKGCETGKHMMIEKPLALSLEECYRVGEAVEKSGVKLMTAFKMRYYPMVKRAKEFIQKPLVTIAQMMDARWSDEIWANDPVKGGGNVLSQGCHTMDLIYFFNHCEPVRVYAEGGNMHHPHLNIIDNIVATVLFENGCIAGVTQGDSGDTPYVSKFSFQMMDGLRSVHLHDRMKTGVFFDGEKTEVHRDTEEFGFLEENRDFIRTLQTGAPLGANHRDGLRATVLILKAFDAIRTGQAQEVKL